MLKVNQSIEVEIRKGAYSGNYASKIEEINEDNIKILTPFKRGEIIPVHIGTNLNIFFTGKDAAYTFHSQVIDRLKEKVRLLVITPPEEINRIQRRDFFRLDVKKDAKYRKVNEELEPEEEYLETSTIDLSAGGVRLALESELAKGDLIEIIIDIPVLEEEIIGEVRQIYSLKNGKAAGIEFKGISQHTRDSIMSWLFDYQRKLRKKGML
ncbi:MAG: flagellar brake protein [Bacillota bacterium]